MNLAGLEPRVRLSVAARTDRGKRRALNEDALFAADPCFIVADGMGGHEQGDVASRAAVSAFSEEFTSPGEASLERIEHAMSEAKARVQAIASRATRGAGCTLSGVVRIEHRGQACWYVFNVGDSRVYIQRGDKLVQLTTDHSLRAELLAEGNERGRLTPRNIITRALGSEDDEQNAWLLPLEVGSRLLICTDGLPVEVTDERIAKVLAIGGSPDSAADELLRQALAAGGSDNITLIVVDVLSVAAHSSGEDAVVGDTTIEVTKPRSR